MKHIVVIYHGGCTDGFTAAWAAWKKFGNKAEYVPMGYQKPLPRGLVNKEIYTLDFAYPEKPLKELLKRNKRVTAIDHHASNEAAVLMTKDYLFDVTHSGAALAWTYFHPTKKLPELIKYVEDGDLWRFTYHNTKAVYLYSDSLPFEFKTWDVFAREMENSKKRKNIIRTGTTLLTYENNLVKRVASDAELVNFQGIKTLVVNSSIFESQIAAELYRALPPIGIVWHKSGDKYKFSLRASKSAKRKVDVSKIAGKFGGGGHPTSAGFQIQANKKLPWRVIKK